MSRRRLFTRIAERPFPALAVFALVVTAAALVASRIHVDYSVEQFFPSWGAERAVFDEYREVFPGEDAQVAFFLATPMGLEPSSYALLAEVAGAFGRHGLEDVRWAGSEPSLVRAAGEREALARAAEAVREHPLHRGFLWNTDQTVMVVQGRLPPTLDHDAARRSLVGALSEEIERLRPPRRWTLSGTPVLRAQVPELLEIDQAFLLGGGILLFFVLLFTWFRHFGLVLISLAAVAPAYLVTLAAMVLAARPITILTSFIPIVILVVGVCDTTHIVEHWSRARARGVGRVDAVADTFEKLAVSCFFTSLTTALGFASLATTGIGVVADFGLFTALAVMTALLFTVTALPALLALVVTTPTAALGRHRGRGPSQALVRGARLALARGSRGVLVGFGVAALSALALGATLRIDTYLVDDLKESTMIMRDLRWIEDSGFGLFQTNLFLRADSARLLSSEMVDWMERFQRVAEREELVAASFGLPDLRRALPAPLETVAGLLPPGIYRADPGAAQVVVTVRDGGSRATLAFLERMDEHLRRDPPPAGTAQLTGTVRMAHTFSFHVLRSFGPSILLALGLIWLVMMALFRSPRLGALAMVPNLFPLLALAGVMGLLGVPLKPSTILVFSIAFGIAVDDSIHLMSRYSHLLSLGRAPGRALRGALRETGSALVMSSVVVSGGFSLLLFSRFELLFLLGLLTAVTAVSALAADLLLFPALIARGEAVSGGGRGEGALVRSHATPVPLRAPAAERITGVELR
jgi:hypothetical protein